MQTNIQPGTYVVAVSGGVDSAALLHVLVQQPGMKLTVAHFDHGIREDSDLDQQHVRSLARQYRLPYVFARGNLGASASEATARAARYGFLHAVRNSANASAVITAHHQDDVLETAILNMVRGSGRRGMTSLKSMDIVKRPLLHVPKQEIIRYAQDNQLIWREDSTNASTNYKRNYIRHKVLSRFTEQDRSELHGIITSMRHCNEQLDQMLDEVVLQLSEHGKLRRSSYLLLPHAVAREVMASWLRSQGITEIDKKMIERLVHAAKTFDPGRRISIARGNSMFISKDYLALKLAER